MAKIQVELGPVQETLLIPLLGRALETKKPSGLINDPKAVEIVDSLDYDFAKWERTSSMPGSAIRTRIYDRFVEAFLSEHPKSTVVEIGSGLNTRFERVDNGEVTWFDLDLPDTIALRRRFFEDAPRRTMIASSVLDTDWMDAVHEGPGPWLFISEAVLIYLENDKARRAITQIGERFERFRFLTDITSAKVISQQAKHDVMKHLSSDSWFRWACDDPNEIAGWVPGMRLMESKTFVDTDRELLQRAPFPWGFLSRWAPWLIRRMMKGYTLNRFDRGL
ncbi:MAG: class I SAM-dependent methyltransferase [Myxococcota bacterium]